MKSRGIGSVLGGIALVVLGVVLLVFQIVPGLWSQFDPTRWWPLLVVGMGLFFAVFAVVARSPALAVPACVVGGVGFLLTWQNLTDNWGSWSWAWALIPGFAGVGAFTGGLLEGKIGSALKNGGTLIVISLVLLAVFGSMMGGPRLLGDYWPVLVILLGVGFVVNALWGMRST